VDALLMISTSLLLGSYDQTLTWWRACW